MLGQHHRVVTPFTKRWDLQDDDRQAMGDLGAALTTSLVVIGDKLGLYRAMADGQPISSDQLAERTDTSERCCREWLSAQASLSQGCGHALGAQAGEAQLGGVIRDAGFTRFRRASETPFNLIFDVRP